MRRSWGAVVVATLLLIATLFSGAIATAGAAGADDPVTIDADGETVTVANAETQVISGTADLEPGTSITVRVQSTGDTEPRFFQSKSTVVDRNGSWAVAFDFYEQSPGDTFEVTIKTDDGEVNATGEVVACETDCTDEQPDQVETVRLDTTDGSVTVNNNASQVVSGTALAPTGTEVSLRLRSTDSEVQFFKSTTAVVTENGTWASAFNFTRSQPDDEFSVEATIDGEYIAESDGEVVDCESDCRDDPPTDTPTPIPASTPDETATPADTSVEFSRNVVQVEQGATARMQLSFEDTDTATLVFGGTDVGYTLEATVRDANGDGQATVHFDTAAAGGDADPLGVSAGDEVSLESETSLDAPLATGDYDFRVVPDDRSDDSASDIGSLYVADPSTDTPNGTATAMPLTTTGSPNGGDAPVEIVVSGALVLGGGALALLLLRG